MPIGPNTKIRNNAIHPTTEPVDNLSHGNLTQAVDLGGELDAIRSQIKRIIRYDGGGNWYDQQPVFRAQGDTSEFVLQNGVDLKIDDGTIVATGDLALDDGNRATSTWSEPIKLSADAEEWSALEDVYGGEKSLIAMLHDAASSSSRFKQSIQVNAISKTSTLFVPDVDWSGDAANYVDVLLNGQLLRGGTDAQVAAGEVDYAIVGQNGIHFSFNIPEDDILTFVVMGGGILGSGGGGAGVGGGSGPSAATSVDPATTFDLAPVVGTSARFAREDHSHGTPPAPVLPQAANTVTSATLFNLTSSAGTSESFARADHMHGTPSIPEHSALNSQGWVGSGHTATPYTVAVFDVSGSASIISPPDAGQRQGKFLSWINDTQLGWSAPALLGVGLLGGMYDLPVIYENSMTPAPELELMGTFYQEFDVVVSDNTLPSNDQFLVTSIGIASTFFATSGLAYINSGAANVSPNDETFP